MTRIALYSNAPILAKRLGSALRIDPTFELMARCGSIEGLLNQVVSEKPDIILLDLAVEVTYALLTDLKSKARRSAIVLLVNTISLDMAMQAMQAGIRGILRKSLPVDLQLKCLKRIQAGGVWFEKALAESLAAVRPVILTPSEKHLVSLLSQGLKNSEIGDLLSISEDAVKGSLANLFGKLGVKDRFELALYGLRNSASLSGNWPRAEAADTEGQASERIPIPLVPTLQ